MSEDIIRVHSISQLHESLGYDKPKHPLISVIDPAALHIPEEVLGIKVISEFYHIALKDRSCGIQYGRNHYDFDEGVLLFTAPGQVTIATEVINPGDIQGWMMYFHADLIHGTHLAEIIDSYSFFNYENHEALHLSEEEERIMTECALNIKREYNRSIDGHSQRVIVSNLELLLNYSLRFYERQFHTRSKANRDVLTQFEYNLKEYFDSGQHTSEGLPSIKHFAEKANLSPHYFSDLLKKESGRAAKDHINDFVVNRAKKMLLGTEDSVSEIAYQLGFNYPHYFTRLFKSRTGVTPGQFRTVN